MATSLPKGELAVYGRSKTRNRITGNGVDAVCSPDVSLPGAPETASRCDATVEMKYRALGENILQPLRSGPSAPQQRSGALEGRAGGISHMVALGLLNLVLTAPSVEEITAWQHSAQNTLFMLSTGYTRISGPLGKDNNLECSCECLLDASVALAMLPRQVNVVEHTHGQIDEALSNACDISSTEYYHICQRPRGRETIEGFEARCGHSSSDQTHGRWHMAISARENSESDAQYHRQCLPSSDTWTLDFVLQVPYPHGSTKQRKATCSRNSNFLADHVLYMFNFISHYMGLWYEPYYTDKSNPTAHWMTAVMAIETYYIVRAAFFDECADGNLIVPWCESPLTNEPNPCDTWVIALAASLVSLMGHPSEGWSYEHGGVLKYTPQ